MAFIKITPPGLSRTGHLPSGDSRIRGLINANARLYDPLLGRFLSPDPYEIRTI
ncbi:MAG: hypothetical protein IKO04_04730 [Bacteroidales bacterium]|nr:hypothetical protein [Bacteroidales bacterium]